MRINRAAVLTAACVTGLLGLPAPFAAAAEAPVLLHVDNSDPAKCSDDGQGTAAQPFCTIQKAADLAGPGQTVVVAYGTTYSAPLAVTRSGEKDKPITIRGYREPGASGIQPVINATGAAALTLNGVHDVAIQNLQVSGGTVVSGSSQIVVDGLEARGQSVNVTGASSDVTISRGIVGTLVVDAGSTGTRVLRNVASGGVRITDASHTVVTNNDAGFTCAPGIAITGSSTATGLYNNVVRQARPSAPCSDLSEIIGVEVTASATTDTTLDSNLIGLFAYGVAYSWAGTTYQTPEQLAAASGGPAVAHDLVTPALKTDTAERDSADATAPGALEPDLVGNAAADDPSQANTGTGDPAYLDRGAFENQDPYAPGWMSLKLNHSQAPYGTDIVATATNGNSTYLWPTTSVSYSFDFGDGTVVKTNDLTVHHTYTSSCACNVTVTATDQTQRQQSSQAPIKVTAPGELAAKASVVPVLPNSTDPASSVAPLSVVLDTSATVSSWRIVSTAVDFGDGNQTTYYDEHSHTYQYMSPGDYTVRTTVTDERGQSSSTTTAVHVDYAASGFLTTQPYRLIDTRSEGASWGGVSGGNTRAFYVPVGTDATPAISGSIASVVLNVTVTDATEDTHLTVWPAGQPRPATSNVNIAAGKTSTNLITVPLGMYHCIDAVLNSGHANVIIDVVGYYQPNAGEKFSPLAPSRLMDSRTSGGTLHADTTRNVKVAGVGGVPAGASAVVLNLTSTQTTEDTYLAVWPHGSARPTSSNLNPEPGKDKSNQVIVPLGPDGTIDLYNHGGTTHAVIDVFGYYGADGTSLFTPIVPRRLADTRTAHALGNDSTMSMATGAPTGATAAVLNVTATDATDSTHLIAFPDGTTRPGTSNLNIGPRQTVPNHVITPLGANGKVNIYNHTGNTQVIADLFGYFTKA